MVDADGEVLTVALKKKENGQAVKPHARLEHRATARLN